jgi:hypothetical protein
MKKILTLGFLLLGLQQLSGQTLPFYDLGYYDSPKCIKALVQHYTELLCFCGSRWEYSNGGFAKLVCSHQSSTVTRAWSRRTTVT